MQHRLRILAPSIFGGFLALTLWRIIVQGFMEKPSFDAPHLRSGAGDFGLTVEFSMAVIGFVVAAFWFFGERRWQFKVLAVVLVFITPALFLFSARGMQRFAPGYSEEAFQKLVALHNSQRSLHAADITAALGEPLIRSESSERGQTWLYSYMPSCGFGWDKKYVLLDSSGGVADIFTNHEP